MNSKKFSGISEQKIFAENAKNIIEKTSDLKNVFFTISF